VEFSRRYSKTTVFASVFILCTADTARHLHSPDAFPSALNIRPIYVI